MQHEGKIRKEEIKDAILRSGYLLEQRVESVLEKEGFYVSANTAYPDPITGKSREIDIEALIGIKLSRDYDLFYPTLICECENNQQPVVFFIKESPISFLNCQEVKSVGLPVQFLERDIPSKHGHKIKEEDQFISLADFLKFEKYHHYCKGFISTQYCNFTRKNKNNPWIAFHSDIQHDSFTNLIFALEAKIDEYYDDYVLPGRNEKDCINIQIYYPVLILQGLLYAAHMEKGKLSLKQCNHIQYRKEYFSKDKHDTYQIDVITEPFLGKYLKIIEAESERAKNTIKRKMKITKESLDKLIGQARKKSPRKSFREIFEF